MKPLLKTVPFLLFLYTCAWAHPHTFIEVKPTIEIKDQHIHKMHIRWVMDEMTSMMLIMDLDTNGNGKFEKSENDFIYENYFISLSQYDFYMHLLKNKKKVPLSQPKNFQASIEDGRIIYAFDIEQPLNTKNLRIAFLDMELFVGMIIQKKYITVKGVKSKDIEQIKKSIFGVK